MGPVVLDQLLIDNQLVVKNQQFLKFLVVSFLSLYDLLLQLMVLTLLHPLAGLLLLGDDILALFLEDVSSHKNFEGIVDSPLDVLLLL